MNKIIFNISILTKYPTGVGIYTIKLLDRLKFHTKDVPSEAYGLDKSNPKITALYRILWNFFILPFKVKRNELVFSFSSHGSPFIKNQIITIHDLICLNFPDHHRMQYFYFKYILPITLRSCIKVVAISEFTKTEIIKYYGIPESKIVVIKNGANYTSHDKNSDAEQEVIRLTSGKPYFICVGATYAHKNIHRLIDAISLTKNDSLFIIVGKDNAYFRTLSAKVKEMKIPNILLLDYISEALLSALYKNALCNIYVSLYEGFGFPPLEAAYFNTISLVSEIPAMKEIYGDAVIYVNPNSIEDMAEKIDMIANGKNDFSTLKLKSAELLKVYTWDKAAFETIKLLKNYI